MFKFFNLAMVWDGLKQISDIWSVSDSEIIEEDEWTIIDNRTKIARERLSSFMLYHDISKVKQTKQMLIEYKKPLNRYLSNMKNAI